MNKTWSVGRKNVDIVIDSDNISRIHAILSFLDGKFYIKDNNSTNGTRIKRNKEFIEAKENVELLPDDILFFASKEITVDELIGMSEKIGLRGIVSDVPSVEIKNKKDKKQKDAVIRCKECLNLITKHEVCSYCGSTLHIGEDA